jgi:parvulin-like peptidyl-prolyl isomerase
MAPMSPQVRAQSHNQEEYDRHMDELYHQTLQALVERALLISEFNARSYKVPPKEADNEYHRILKENFNNHVSELVGSLQQQGLTLTAYHKRLEENLMVTALQNHFRHELPEITPEQIQTYYNANLNKFARGGSVHLSVITLKTMTNEPVDVLHQTADTITGQIKAGEDFDKAAQEHNQEGQPDWGWLAMNDLSDPVKEAVSNMKVGDVSAPIIIDGPKVLLVKLVERKNEGVTPINDVREGIKKELFEKQASAAYEKWIAQLHKKFFVKING